MNGGRRLGSHVGKFADRGGQLMQKATFNSLSSFSNRCWKFAAGGAAMLLCSVAAFAQQPAPESVGGEANLKLPDLSSVTFLNGIDGHKLLLFGIFFCILGLAFGLAIYSHLKNLPVHKSMLEISDLIYETCKTYLITQGKFLMLLEAFIAVVIVLYFGMLLHYE